MSWWTEVILAATSLEDVGPDDGHEKYPAVEQINQWLAENSNSQLFLIRHPDPQRHGPQDCFAGSFKGLNRDGFIEAVNQAAWEWREQVQIFLRQEDDKGFQEMKLRAHGQERNNN